MLIGRSMAPSLPGLTLYRRALVPGHSRNGQSITQVLSRFAPQAKLARNHGPNVMDGSRRYPVTFLLPAGLTLRASVQHQPDQERIEEASGPTVARAGEVLA